MALIFVPGCGPAEDSQAETVPAVQIDLSTATFVGDQACAGCHSDIVDTYAETNHRTGFGPFDPATAIEDIENAPRLYDDASNLYYHVYVENDSLYQREYRLDVNGTRIHERIHAADYVIGSGNQTRSYLMEENGFLTEMPVTWYVEQQRWDLSPGYRDINDRFDRKIILECVTCHNAVPAPSPHTQNHYQAIPEGITCERCHGPASLHIETQQNDTTEFVGASIINPAHLTRGEQMANCQQCHLAGIAVFQPGEDPTTFRPGQSLAENRTVYVPEQHLVDPEWVGIDSHPLRLARSACYAASEMTCSTCHDPHKAKEALAPNHFNNQCAACHTPDATDTMGGVCGRPDAPDASLHDAGNCISCHMQRGGTSDVPHVSFTDHWIRRDPGPPLDPEKGRSMLTEQDPIEIVALQQLGRSDHVLDRREVESAQAKTEEAIAFFAFYEQMHALPEYLPRVVRQARAGIEGGAHHPEGYMALARSLAALDSMDQAITVLLDASNRYPENPWVFFWLGSFRTERAEFDGAIGALQRAVRLQPNFMEAQVKLADAYFAAQRFEEAQTQLEALVERDPLFNPKAWYNLGLIYLQQRLTLQAEEALEKASSLDPDLVDAHLQLGTLQLAAQRLDEAERNFRKVIEADENNPQGYGSLAQVFLVRGDIPRARQLLNIVLQLDPSNQPARILLQRISG